MSERDREILLRPCRKSGKDFFARVNRKPTVSRLPCLFDPNARSPKGSCYARCFVLVVVLLSKRIARFVHQFIANAIDSLLNLRDGGAFRLSAQAQIY